MKNQKRICGRQRRIVRPVARHKKETLISQLSPDILLPWIGKMSYRLSYATLLIYMRDKRTRSANNLLRIFGQTCKTHSIHTATQPQRKTKYQNSYCSHTISNTHRYMHGICGYCVLAHTVNNVQCVSFAWPHVRWMCARSIVQNGNLCPMRTDWKKKKRFRKYCK